MSILNDYKKYESEGKTPYITMDKLKPFYLYRIHARNAVLGIWLPEKKGFMIRRNKFGDWFDFIEYHYDSDPCFGTVKPLKELEKTPFAEKDFKNTTTIDNIIEYLKNKTKEITNEEE